MSMWPAGSVDRGFLIREDLCLEVGGFGAPAVLVRIRGWRMARQLPAAARTRAGWNGVRLRLTNQQVSEHAADVAVDMPLGVGSARCHGCATLRHGTPNQYGRMLACWVEGLPENADCGNVRLWLGDRSLRVLWVGENRWL